MFEGFAVEKVNGEALTAVEALSVYLVEKIVGACAQIPQADVRVLLRDYYVFASTRESREVDIGPFLDTMTFQDDPEDFEFTNSNELLPLVGDISCSEPHQNDKCNRHDSHNIRIVTLVCASMPRESPFCRKTS